MSKRKKKNNEHPTTVDTVDRTNEHENNKEQSSDTGVVGIFDERSDLHEESDEPYL